ncbi:MAG: hypothetical protein ACK5CE_10280 [Actinomycetes bacterium]|jgi:hypothetical protein
METTDTRACSHSLLPKIVVDVTNSPVQTPASWKSTLALALCCLVATMVFASRQQIWAAAASAFGVLSLPAGVGAAIRRTSVDRPRLLARSWLRLRPREADGRSSGGWAWQAFVAVWCFSFIIVAAISDVLIVVAALSVVLAASSCLAGYLAFAHFIERPSLRSEMDPHHRRDS